MRTKLFAGVLALYFLWSPVWASPNFAKKAEGGREPAIERSTGRLRVGEKLVFDVHWMGLHVGFGSLEVREMTERSGRPAYHVVAIARTNDVLSKLYPVYDEIHSWFDAEGFASYEFAKKLREGRYRADERVKFDPVKHVGFYESFLNGSRKEFPVPENAKDFLSIFYWFRVQPLEVGQSVRAVLSDRGKDYSVEIDVIKKEKKELRRLGPVWTVLSEPRTLYKGVLYRRGRGWVNFTLDSARVPVFIKLQTPFGPVTGALKNTGEESLN